MLSFFPLDVLAEIWDLIESVSEGLLSRRDRIPVSICQRVSTPFFDPVLGVEGCERERPCSDVAHRCDGALTAGHPCHSGRDAFRRGPLLLLVPDVLLRDILFTPFAILVFFFRQPQ